MFRKLGIFFCRLGTVLYLRLRICQAKSWLYRRLFERKYQNIQVPAYQNMDDLVAFICRLIWTADSWAQLFDAFSYPGKIQYVGTEGDRRIGDCDEFALYCATAIANSNLEYKNPRILTVAYMQRDGTLGGHNVCLLERDGGYAYMDYGRPHHYATVRETVQGVLDRYGNEGTVCLGWGTTDPKTLAPLEVHWS